jgi:fatty-acyl-CoA synthase
VYARFAQAASDCSASNLKSTQNRIHEQWGEAPHALVVLKQNARADERELLEFARANLAHFKAPHTVTFVTELPKTATGKIQKYILRAQRRAIAPQ